MLRFLKIFSVVSLLFSLISCSYVQNSGLVPNRETEYLKAQSSPPLNIPPGLSSSTIEAHYPVSERVYAESAKKAELTPPELSTKASGKKTKTG